MALVLPGFRENLIRQCPGINVISSVYQPFISRFKGVVDLRIVCKKLATIMDDRKIKIINIQRKQDRDKVESSDKPCERGREFQRNLLSGMTTYCNQLEKKDWNQWMVLCEKDLSFERRISTLSNALGESNRTRLVIYGI